MGIILLTVLLAGILAGFPVAFAIGLANVAALFLGNWFFGYSLPITIIVQRMVAGVDGFIFLAIPLFLFAGEIMAEGGIGRRLFKFCITLVGHVTGGLAHVNILASMIFAGVTGAAVADTAAIGSMIIPEMKKNRYPSGLAAAVTGASSTIGVIIPPSIPMLLYAVVAETSVISLFLAGFIPGILIGLALMGISYVIAKRNGYGDKRRQASWAYLVTDAIQAIPALLMPVIMIGGIVGGIFTPTEGAAIAVAYGLVVSAFIYRELKPSQLPRMLHRTVIGTGAILFLLANANLFGWLITIDRVPLTFVNTIMALTDNPTLIVLLMIGAYLFAGLFMDLSVNILILVPVFLPLVNLIGMDLVHFGLITVVALSIGLITPPFGVCLIVATHIADINIVEATKALIPFYGVMLILLLVLTFVPSLTLFLPNLAGN